jgi:hypothetical protein
MTEKNILLSNKTYSEKDQQIAKKQSHAINQRFNKWLVSFKFLLDQTEVDTVFSNQSESCETIILSEKERVSKYQRLLLDVEKSSVIKKQSELAKKQQFHENIVKDLVSEHEKIFKQFIDSKEITELLKMPYGLSDFISFAYSESVTVTKIHDVVYTNLSLSETILSLVNNESFCKSINKPLKNIRDVKTAIGYIGVDKCKVLVPVLMLKPLLKWNDRNIHLIAPKIWQQAILTGNVTKKRLSDAGYKEPDEGIAIGLIRNIGHFIINNHYTRTFEKTMEKMMINYRENGLMEEYYACANIIPKMTFLPEMLGKLSEDLTTEIINNINWGQKNHLKIALLDDINDVPVLQRSTHGIALMQAKAYTSYNLMSKSKAFVAAHSNALFAHCLLSKDDQKEITKSSPGLINK